MQPSSHDEQVFDINDFTTASDWEKFISDLEQVLRQWGLSAGGRQAGTKRLTRAQLSAADWTVKTEAVRFSRVPLLLHHLYVKGLSDAEQLDEHSLRRGHELPIALQDTASGDHDFVANCPAVSRLFGLREFVLIASADTKQPINNIDRIKLLISSSAISLGNIACTVPVFVQVTASHFVGIFQDSDIRTNFEMVCLDEVPSKLRHLSSLLALFKEKLGYPSTESLSVRVSVRFVNILQRYDCICFPSLRHRDHV